LSTKERDRNGSIRNVHSAVFSWLAETTLIASIVICLILALQKLLGVGLGPRWCHALWLVLVIRMVLPWTPSSPISLFSLIPTSVQDYQQRPSLENIEQQGHFASGGLSERTEPRTASGSEAGRDVLPATAPRPQKAAKVEARSGLSSAGVRLILPLLWLAGAIILLGYLAASNFALWRIIKRQHPLIEQPILELFEQCKSEMGVATIVALVPSDQVRTAALFGFVRPRLLLPREMTETASREEPRYVFLHELAHLKRHDIYLCWLTSLLQVLHWFNPLVWLAFYRVRADRELACDALVLTRTGQDKSQEYGGAIVGLLRRFSRSRALPAMAGILENRETVANLPA